MMENYLYSVIDRYTGRQKGFEIKPDHPSVAIKCLFNNNI